jgi:hypothetical protein
MIKPKKCLFWIDDIDKILQGKRVPEAIGGANVQLSFWAKCFADQGWLSYTFTYNLKQCFRLEKGVHFLYIPLVRKVMFLLYNFKFLWLFILRPDYVVTRANPRSLALLSKLSKLLKFKLIHTLASDFDVEPHKSDFSSLESYLKSVDTIVVQNQYQQQACQKKLNRRCSVIPNIWDSSVFATAGESNKYDAIWIANFRALKRPGWFLHLAAELPQFRFAMVGTQLERECYQLSVKRSEEIENLDFLGYRSLHEVDQLIANSRILVLTSEIEGFPNTFLHAWSHSKPVVSTVNPSGVITEMNTGVEVESLSELVEKCKLLLTDIHLYEEKKQSVVAYFEKSHSPSVNFDKLMKIISEK